MNNKIKIIAITGALVATSIVSCKDEFLNRPPVGAISENAISNATGVDGALVQAYRTLIGNNIANWYTSPWNWVWGSVRSGEAYKGSEPNDQNQLNPIERYEVLPNNGSVRDKWRAVYDGVGMANGAIRLIALATDMDDDAKSKAMGEARFLRGFHHFEAKRTFNRVPYVAETATTTEDYRSLSNSVDIWPQIEEDLKYAYENLPSTQSELGRVNKWQAGAFYGKALLYQKKFAEAKAVFDDVIANGVTNKNEKFGLLPKYSDVFRGANENSKEVIFGVQTTVTDNSNFANAFLDAELTNPHNDGPGGCCGFYQPSQTLANTFKTDGGLPLDNPHASNVKQHENSPADFPDRGSFDPRLDHTVGRVGVSYLDWGPAKSTWIRQLSSGGPFIPKKNVHTKAELASGFQAPGAWGQPESGRNILVMRYSDLVLMAAECEAELGNLAKALEYVNMIRTRAANPDDFVKDADGDPEADYEVANYPSFGSKEEALQAIKTERVLELAMEGHHFYDLVRWGDAEAEIDAYISREAPIRTHLKDASFGSEDLYLPIPEFVISQSGGSITQN
jgi:starch-binding outer membrane protein, SusD/RagB family